MADDAPMSPVASELDADFLEQDDLDVAPRRPPRGRPWQQHDDEYGGDPTAQVLRDRLTLQASTNRLNMATSRNQHQETKSRLNEQQRGDSVLMSRIQGAHRELATQQRTSRAEQHLIDKHRKEVDSRLHKEFASLKKRMMSITSQLKFRPQPDQPFGSARSSAIPDALGSPRGNNFDDPDVLPNEDDMDIDDIIGDFSARPDNQRGSAPYFQRDNMPDLFVPQRKLPTVKALRAASPVFIGEEMEEYYRINPRVSSEPLWGSDSSTVMWVLKSRDAQPNWAPVITPNNVAYIFRHMDGGVIVKGYMRVKIEHVRWQPNESRWVGKIKFSKTQYIPALKARNAIRVDDGGIVPQRSLVG